MKRNRGWPWPQLSFGLGPMFGEDGWCRDCGMPLREQQGSLTLERKGMATISGGWVPYWQYDTICLEQSLADEAAARFTLDLRPVEWRGFPPGSAQQIVIPTVGTQWFDADELRTAAIARHGSAGARAAPVCSNSIDTLSGLRTNAMRPSRGGRLISTPLACRCAQVA